MSEEYLNALQECKDHTVLVEAAIRLESLIDRTGYDSMQEYYKEQLNILNKRIKELTTTNYKVGDRLFDTKYKRYVKVIACEGNVYTVQNDRKNIQVIEGKYLTKRGS